MALAAQKNVILPRFTHSVYYMNVRALIFYFAICGIVNSAGGQHPVAAGVFDRSDIETGDTFVLRILVSGTEARPDRADFRPWSRWIPAENVLSAGQWTRSGAQWINNYTLIAFDSFHTTLPSLPVRWALPPVSGFDSIKETGRSAHLTDQNHRPDSRIFFDFFALCSLTL